MKYPAKEHARKVAKNLKQFASSKNENVDNSAIVIETPELKSYPHCDQSQPYRCDRYFMYFTGCHDQPGCKVSYDLGEDKLVMYLPEIDWDDVMWSGMPMSIDQAKNKYDVDEVKYVTELNKDLSNKQTLAVEDNEYAKFSQLLIEAIDEARAFKDEYELGLLKKASQITDNSHLAVMSALPIEHNEGHIHAEFVYHAMRQGSKNVAYDPICCAGTNAGTLHYIKNDEDMDGRQLVLIDAGAEHECYAADVTRCFPINGEWTQEARAIYDTVRDMQTQCANAAKPGVLWDDLHILSHKILVKSLLKLGVLHNGSEEEIFESRVSTAFSAHGLGHMLGMNTHDTSGRANYEDPDPLLRYLRIRRKLEKGMYVTIEPGCYFNEYLINLALKDEKQAKYINQEALKKYMPVGGVRIEDDYLVTEDGVKNFTGITSDPDEIARIVKEGISKGREHFHNIV